MRVGEDDFSATVKLPDRIRQERAPEEPLPIDTTGTPTPPAGLSIACVIEYVVHPPALAPDLVGHLRERGFDASNFGAQLWATHPDAADPTEERIVLGGVIAAWRREHPDARIDLAGPSAGRGRD